LDSKEFTNCRTASCPCLMQAGIPIPL
jgi:hypothetical protein